MTNQNYTDITFVLDRSGSMADCYDATISGFNEFLAVQRRDAKGRVSLSMVQFDDIYELVRAGVPLADFPNLSRETFIPRGATKLLDAIGRTISDTGMRLASMPEADRPGKVLIIILTDGGENSSTEYSREKVNEMISRQKTQYLWDFTFIGANQDAIATAASMGIGAGKAFTYAANARGTSSAFLSAANYSASATGCVDAREMQDLKFTKADLDAQDSAGAAT